jgi:mannosylglycerate hydrolase
VQLVETLRGISKADSYGAATKIGYTSFGWGQTAHLPQIYSGFGIDFVIVSKNVSVMRAPNSEFIWSSPDGTKLLATRLGTSCTCQPGIGPPYTLSYLIVS